MNLSLIWFIYISKEKKKDNILEFIILFIIGDCFSCAVWLGYSFVFSFGLLKVFQRLWNLPLPAFWFRSCWRFLILTLTQNLSHFILFLCFSLSILGGIIFCYRLLDNFFFLLLFFLCNLYDLCYFDPGFPCFPDCCCDKDDYFSLFLVFHQIPCFTAKALPSWEYQQV